MPGNDRYTSVMLHFESSLADDNDFGNSGNSPHTWTTSSATVSSTFSKFGTGSLNNGAGTGATITPISNDFLFGSGNFTIDTWINLQGGTNLQKDIAGMITAGATNRPFTLVVIGSSFVNFATTTSTGGLVNFTGSIAVTTASSWTHIAVVRSGSTLSIYVNGILDASIAITGSITALTSTNNLAIGVQGDSVVSTPFNGFIDEFRITTGVARWTTNFTPPVVAYDTYPGIQLTVESDFISQKTEIVAY